MTRDGEVRRPWRRVAVPGEGLANRGIERAHEHQGKLGMRFPYLDWPRRGQRDAVDGEVVFGQLQREAARGGGDSGDGGQGVRPDQVGG
jgi:hypothetical protein